MLHDFSYLPGVFQNNENAPLALVSNVDSKLRLDGILHDLASSL